MADNLYLKTQIEIYDSSNVRVCYMNKEKNILYKKTRYDIDYVDKAEAGPPVVPAEKAINLIASAIEYFSLVSDRLVKVKINDSLELKVNGCLILSGTFITSVVVINEDVSNTVKLEIVQGDELA